MTCHNAYEGCPHMCPAKCHFGPCPPCSKRDVTARCRCGKIRKQLPCAEVWNDNKQLVLQCGDDCNVEPLAESAADKAECEGSPVSCVKNEIRDVLTAEEVRERRKDKRKKRDEGLEERRLREEAIQRRQATIRRVRMIAFAVSAFLLIIFVFYMIVKLREQEIKDRERFKGR